MRAMRSKRINGVHVVVGVASRVIWQHFSVLGHCGKIKLFLRAFECQDVTTQRCWSKDKLQRNPRRWDMSRKVSMLFVPVGIRVAFAGDVESLRSLDIGRMAQNQMPVRRQYFFI